MAQTNLEITIKENAIKNLIVLICCFLFYPNLQNGLSDISSEVMGNFLLTISIFLVTVCFANFAFTYEKININSLGSRLLAHSATFLFLLLTALLLETMTIAIGIVYPSIYGIAIIFSVLLYLSIFLYDIWDLFRIR